MKTTSAQGIEYLNGLRSELKLYFCELQATSAERKAVRAWVREGNSYSDNPYSIYGEDGKLMDYISAQRFDEDVLMTIPSTESEYSGFYSQDDLPF